MGRTACLGRSGGSMPCNEADWNLVKTDVHFSFKDKTGGGPIPKFQLWEKKDH